MSAATPGAPPVIRNIQILRAFAAILVVVAHLGSEVDRWGLRTVLSGISGGWGIHIFFVISGFIMVYTAGHQFGRSGAATEFMRRRLIRIVPLYWFLTTAFLVASIFLPTLLNVPIGDWAHVLGSYLFIPAMRPNGEIRPALALGWTLNFEMLFYVLFAAAMTTSFRRGVAAIAAVFCGLIVIGQFGPWGVVALDFWSNAILVNFLYGIGIGILALRRWSLPGPMAVLLAALSVGLWLTVREPDGARNILNDTIVPSIAAAMLVAAGALGPDARASQPTRFGVFLGEVSYALYLVHPFVIRPVAVVWTRAFGPTAPFAYVLVALVASCVLAACLYLAFERPMSRWLNRLWRPAREPRTPALEPAAPAAGDRRG